MRRSLFILLLLAGITLACFWPVGRMGFIAYDDFEYVSQNPTVLSGLNWNSLVWAFTSSHSSNWHPVTWLSHMLDCQWFGLNPAEEHWVNLGFHTANALLLFLLLRQLTGARWRSFLVAALFAIHPLHIQSVAWISERKDVLSVFFGLLTLLAYGKAVVKLQSPKSKDHASMGKEVADLEPVGAAGSGTQAVKLQSPKSKIQEKSKDQFSMGKEAADREPPLVARRLWSAVRRPEIFFWRAAIVLFALGLMAKPMLVTLPFVMLLLDFWPLGRCSDNPGDSVPSPDAKSNSRNEESRKQKGDCGSANERGEAQGWDGGNGAVPACGITYPSAATGSSDSSPITTRVITHHPSLLQLMTCWRPLLIEKRAFFALSFVSCLITIWAQQGSIAPMTVIPAAERCLHAVVSYTLYLEKLFWPVNLAIFYPFTHLALATQAVLLLPPVGLTVICCWQWRARPYLIVGWCWFVISLIPVIGLMQVGLQSMADRYAYLPAIGLFIMVAWGLAEIANRSRVWRLVMAGLGAGLLLACGLDTRYQLGFWRDSVTLFKQVLAVTPENNPMGHFYLGVAYKGLHDLDHAATSFAAAVQADPSFSKARTELGNVLVYQEKYAAAEQEFRRVLERHPDNVAVHVTLGFALAKQHRDAEAQTEYLIARQLNPADDTIRALLAASTRRVEAELTLTNLTRQLGTNASPELHIQIGATESGLGHFRAAMDHYQTALRLAADSPDGLNNLAWLLATCPDASLRDGRRAVSLAERACTLTQFKTTVFVGTLAAAYAEAGRFADATTTAQKACDLAAARGEVGLLQRNQELLARYRQHQPWHEPGE